MKKQLFNDNWSVKTGVQGEFEAMFAGISAGKPVTLPHDAMIEEDRDPACASGGQSGFYPTKSYSYRKKFTAPKDWEGKTILVEFEGVMQNALVYLNNEFLGGHKYGYSGFIVDLTPALKYGEENELKVLAIGQERWSRWYSGMGIYRDVYLHTAGEVYIAENSLKITTESIEDDYATLLIEGEIQNRTPRRKTVKLVSEIADEAVVTKDTRFIELKENGTTTFSARVTVDAPKLWSPDTPTMYTCTAKLFENDTALDEATDRFGIRILQLDARRGLRINGKTVKLRGACIHHDNGIIGCTNLYDAERFRMGQLKNAGFNAIRSAHHPAGNSLLRTCDDVGILVMDELTDMWNEPMNPNDFANDFNTVWRDECARMVKKDYNHPSVVLYSTGNEIPEIGNSEGTARHREIAARLHELDSTRFTTCGINGYLAVSDILSAMTREEATNTTGRERDTAGAEALNKMMGAAQWDRTDRFSVDPRLTERLERAVSAVDVAGYNYLTARHVPEHEAHPDRVVVGSETFPPEIGRLWKIVEENPHVIGDFTWTGYDYLGEAGIGIPHYTEVKGQNVYPDRLAYCGDINLNADRRPVSYLREIAFGLRKAPFIAVHRVNVFGKPFDPNNWKYFDAIDSWTFPGCEDKPTRVYVLANCDEVELFLNGKSLGRKEVGEAIPYTAAYDLNYTPGELKAVGYKNGAPCGENVLKTAASPAKMQVKSSAETITGNGQGMAFITVDLLDETGIRSRFEEKTVAVTIEGAGTLQGFGSANPSSEDKYQQASCQTFDGRVMAAVRGAGSGTCKVTFTCDPLPPVTVELNVTAADDVSYTLEDCKKEWDLQ